MIMHLNSLLGKMKFPKIYFKSGFQVSKEIKEMKKTINSKKSFKIKSFKVKEIL